MRNSINEMEPQLRSRLRKKLKAWYETSARDLPWRANRDPYRIWISEIMLQQTTVVAVIPYYERFFQRFPNLETLAQAGEEDVLKLWEGLGYYSRARNIHKAARKLWEERKGVFPKNVEELEELPGIGRYTAGAIVSFAYDLKAPIVEANTLRLYSRLIGFDGDPRSSAGQQRLWNFAGEMLTNHSPGRLNQAFMELGSRICTPRDPNCASCPVQRECRAFAEGRQSEIPKQPARIPLTDLTEINIAVRKGNSYLLRQCGEGERWTGLWDFPRFQLDPGEIETANGANSESAASSPAKLATQSIGHLQKLIQEAMGIEAEIGSFAKQIRHGVTRYRIRLYCFLGKYAGGQPSDKDRVRFIPVAKLADYPLSRTARTFANFLSDGE